MLLPERHYRARARAAFINLAFVVVILATVAVLVAGAVMDRVAEFNEQIESITDVE